jgi:putative transposase
MAIKRDALDGLLAGRDPRAVFAKDGLFDELKKALAERVLNAEIDDHLDGEAAAGKRNSRNGYSKKRVLTETSKLDLRIPRDREGTFDPKLIARYQRRFPGFDEKIVSMYARGMTVREIQGHLLELYALRAGSGGAASLSHRMGRKGASLQEDARPRLGLARLRCVAISVSVLARADA